MAGDINLREQIIILPSDKDISTRSLARSLVQTGGRIMHEYGPRVQIVELPSGREELLSRAMPGVMAPAAQAIAIPEDLDEVGRYGLQAMQLRESQAFARAKANRPHNGQSWQEGGSEALRCTDEATTRAEAQALANAPSTSARLTGSVAVGLIIVEGPDDGLQFSPDERAKVVAEVQNGLGWLGSQNPAAAVVWKYDIHVIQVDVQPGPDNLSFGDKEALWRDPAMKQMGYGSGMSAVRKYVEDIRTKLNTEWTYCAFFTKYPVGHFAYASVGGPRLVMHYQNDGWGPDNIDRVFTHETGHIFGAPDEYSGSGCNCGGSWGYHQKPNANCEKCNPQSVDCIMKANTWDMCEHTPYHLGFPIPEERYSGVWRSGTYKQALWVKQNWTDFIGKWRNLAAQGMRLIDLKITTGSDGRLYHGVWREGNEGYGLWVNADWNNFHSKWADWSKRGLRLIDLEVITSGSKLLYSGVFTAGGGAYGLWANADWNNFKAKWEEWGKQGLRLVDIKVLNVNGELRYSGVWREGKGGYALWVNAGWESFNEKWREWAGQGYRLVDLEIVVVNGERRYFGVWESGKDGYGLWVNAGWNSFLAKWDEWAAKGYRLVDLDVYYPDSVNSPLPQDAHALGLTADENGAMGIGFLSSEDGTLGAEADLETGDFVLGTLTDAEQQAAALATGFGHNGEINLPAMREPQALGGMAPGAQASANGEDGLGGVIGTGAEADAGGLGGVVF